MKKPVTITIEGYDHKQVTPALIRKFFEDNPKATRALAARAIGLSAVSISKHLKALGIDQGPALSHRDIAAIARLQKKGIEITIPTRVRKTPGGRQSSWKVDMSPLLEKVGASVEVMNYKLNTVKTYAQRWASVQNTRIRLTCTENDGVVTIKRTI